MADALMGALNEVQLSPSETVDLGWLAGCVGPRATSANELRVPKTMARRREE